MKMSRPSKFVDGDYTKQQTRSGVVFNGPRPSPLKLKQESHTIHKKIIKPIIIYIRSPEIIHTKPHDFMALVQKLTGHDSAGSKHQQQQQHKKTLMKQDGASYDLNDDINELAIDNTSSGEGNNNNTIMKPKSPMFNTPANPNVYDQYDIPLFTPNMSDYFFSPQRFFRFSNRESPNTSISLSPGSQLVEIMKRQLPEI